MVLALSPNFGFAQTQLDMTAEASDNYARADKELNATYHKIVKEYKGDAAFIKNLKAAQNIWIKFRDAEAMLKYPDREPGYYGSMQPVCWYNYLEELTRKRTAELKVWLFGIEEGDSCSGSVKTK